MIDTLRKTTLYVCLWKGCSRKVKMKQKALTVPDTRKNDVSVMAF